MIQTADGAVGGRYRLIRLVGEGGMGRVWHARDETLDRDVALKEFTLPSGIGAAGRGRLGDRIKREARLVARLNHPGIVRVYDIVDHGGSPVIVMEFIPGESLAARIRRDGQIPAATAVSMAGRLLAALRHAHAADIVHRDIKPDNILLTENRCVLTDFGIARSLGGAVSTLTAGGTLVGTPAYLAPEVLQGQEATTAADLWSLGATLFAAVEGTDPFTGTTVDEMFSSILDDPIPSAPHAGPLAPLLRALLVKDPAKRATLQAATVLIGASPMPVPDHVQQPIHVQPNHVPQQGAPAEPEPVGNGNDPWLPVPAMAAAAPAPANAGAQAGAWLPVTSTKPETPLPLAPTEIEIPAPLNPTKIELSPPTRPETPAAPKTLPDPQSVPGPSPAPRRTPVSTKLVLRFVAFYTTRLSLIAAGVLGGLYAFEPFVLLRNASSCQMAYFSVQCASRGAGQSAAIDAWNNTPMCWAPAAILMALGVAGFAALPMPPDRSTVLARFAIVLGLASALDLIVRAAQWSLFLNSDKSHWPATPQPGIGCYIGVAAATLAFLSGLAMRAAARWGEHAARR